MTFKPLSFIRALLAASSLTIFSFGVAAQSQKPLEFGVGLFQPDKEKNDAMGPRWYRPSSTRASQSISPS